MQLEKREYKTYEFDELSEEAKEKAINDNYDINVDYGWYYDDPTLDLAEEYGLKVSLGEMCFDLDRGSYVYFDAKHDGSDHTAQIFVDDYKKFAKKAGIDLRKEKNLDGNISIDCEHFAGSYGRNNIQVGSEVSMEAEKKLDEALKNFLEDVLKALKENYEYRTATNSIEDTLRANEYRFFADGKMFDLQAFDPVSGFDWGQA